jgi:hypothetical protein
MDWTLRDDDGDGMGMATLLARAQDALGGPPLAGSRFLRDARAMLRATRLIERTVAGADTTLHVGFQTAGKLDGEGAVYRSLTAGGTTVHGYGAGWPHDDAGVRWHPLADDPLDLANQWFLVTRSPAPIAFVGFERSPGAVRAMGGALATRKVWDGFVTDDERLVDSVIGHLGRVVAAAAPAPPDGDGPLYLVATDDGSSALGAVRERGLTLAQRDGARVLLYDRSAESRLTDPYDVGPWGRDRDGVGPGSRLEPDVLEGLGRRYLADQLRLARARGLDAQVFLPRRTGATALAEACTRFGPALVVLPAAMAAPSLVDRISRNTLTDVALPEGIEVVRVDPAT